MKKTYRFLIFMISLLGFLMISSCAHNNLNYQKKILERSSFLKIEKAIIISSCKDGETCSQRKLRSSGSGAVVKSTFAGGYVLTAAHVCDDSDVISRIKITEPDLLVPCEAI